MKRINGYRAYLLGAHLNTLWNVIQQTGITFFQTWRFTKNASQVLQEFVTDETIPFPGSKAKAESLIDALKKLQTEDRLEHPDQTLPPKEIITITKITISMITQSGISSSLYDDGSAVS